MEKEQFYKILNHPELLDGNTLVALNDMVEKYPFFQTARLLYLKNLQMSGRPGFDQELKKIAPLVASRKQLKRILNPEFSGEPVIHFETIDSASGFDLETPAGPHQGDDLIDKFLSTAASLRKMPFQHGENNPKNVDFERVEKSMSVSDDLITETLATLYYEQKKYDQALEAFQKLSLKYPEKSIYFASRIEEIEKLKNI